MTTWRLGKGSVHEISEWHKVDEFSTLVRDLSSGLDMGPDMTWLQYLLDEVSELIPRTLEEGWQQEHAAEFILSLYDAVTYLTLVEYYVIFMHHEGYITPERAMTLEAKIEDLNAELSSLTARTREGLGPTPKSGPGYPSWSRN